MFLSYGCASILHHLYLWIKYRTMAHQESLRNRRTHKMRLFKHDNEIDGCNESRYLNEIVILVSCIIPFFYD